MQNYFSADTWNDAFNTGYAEPVGVCPVCGCIVYPSDPHYLFDGEEVAVCADHAVDYVYRNYRDDKTGDFDFGDGGGVIPGDDMVDYMIDCYFVAA